MIAEPSTAADAGLGGESAAGPTDVDAHVVLGENMEDSPVCDENRRAPEVCDGQDNDCDGDVDEDEASKSCVQVADGGTTALCVDGACKVSCSDPDADFIDGKCARHDDCPSPNPCDPGRCVDGRRTFTCECPKGYSGSGTTACQDVDECAGTVMHPCSTNPLACVNTAGGFMCRCPGGYVGDGVGAGGCLDGDAWCRIQSMLQAGVRDSLCGGITNVR
jgi:hypothetical protein